MPRPDSKIMNLGDAIAAAGSTPPPASVTGNVVKINRSPAAADKAAAKEAAKAAAKAEKEAAKQAAADKKAADKQAALDKAAADKAAKDELLGALDVARGPLNDIEKGLADHAKAVVAQGLAHEKELGVIERAKSKAILAHGKVQNAQDKALAALKAKQEKFTAAFDKTKLKIDAKLAKIK